MRQDLVVDVVFTTLVVLVMATMKVPKKGLLPSVYHNITFWIYAAFWVKTIGTIVRIPIYYSGSQSPENIMIWFNWSGSFIATLSTVLPTEFVHHYTKYGALVPMSMHARLIGCVTVAIVYCCALIVCALVIYAEVTTSKTVLFVWRIFFFANAAVEVTMLAWNFILIRKYATSIKNVRGIQLHLAITLYMRGGLCTLIILKICNAFRYEYLAIAHLWFIFTGLFAFHIKMLARDTRSSKSFASFQKWFRRTEEAFVFDTKIQDLQDKPTLLSATASTSQQQQQQQQQTLQTPSTQHLKKDLITTYERPPEFDHLQSKNEDELRILLEDQDQFDMWFGSLSEVEAKTEQLVLLMQQSAELAGLLSCLCVY
eukprot:c9294_g1_i4.p1 GENE.c9294_g1_i4~~c9294_g1_i4.p1  ORF type:complete len:370 (+),score=55.50 c9294_g1_i4:30-1139(+)